MNYYKYILWEYSNRRMIKDRWTRKNSITCQIYISKIIYQNNLNNNFFSTFLYSVYHVQLNNLYFAANFAANPWYFSVRKRSGITYSKANYALNGTLYHSKELFLSNFIVHRRSHMYRSNCTDSNRNIATSISQTCLWNVQNC